MTITRICACLLAFALAGCAGQRAPSSSAALADSGTAAAQHTDDVIDPGKVDADKVMAAQAAGYKIVRENGETLYCRREKQTGSRVRDKTMCLTKKEWERSRESTRQTLQDIARERPRPPGT